MRLDFSFNFLNIFLIFPPIFSQLLKPFFRKQDVVVPEKKTKRISRRTLTMLSQMVMKFVNELEKSDPQDVFAMPVTDQIAPGYSTMIRHPMDFSTIKAKCEGLEYESLAAVRFDAHLMCSNCLKYNTEDTPFHSLATKMQKEVDRIFQVKRAIKFLRRDNVDPNKINEIFEMDRFVLLLLKSN